MANRAALAVVASRIRLTVWLSGSRPASAMIRGPSVSGQASRLGEALPGPVAEIGEHQVGAVDLVAGGAEVLADRAEGGAPAGAVFHQPNGLRPVRVGAGAGVDAQLGLQRRGDLSGGDEADQAAGVGGWLGPGGQPDGQPPGGDVIDAVPSLVGGGGAVADQALVQGQVRQQSVLGQPAGASRVLPGGLEAVPGWLVNRAASLPSGPPARSS